MAAASTVAGAPARAATVSGEVSGSVDCSSLDWTYKSLDLTTTFQGLAAQTTYDLTLNTHTLTSGPTTVVHVTTGTQAATVTWSGPATLDSYDLNEWMIGQQVSWSLAASSTTTTLTSGSLTITGNCSFPGLDTASASVSGTVTCPSDANHQRGGLAFSAHISGLQTLVTSGAVGRGNTDGVEINLDTAYQAGKTPTGGISSVGNRFGVPVAPDGTLTLDAVETNTAGVVDLTHAGETLTWALYLRSQYLPVLQGSFVVTGTDCGTSSGGSSGSTPAPGSGTNRPTHLPLVSSQQTLDPGNCSQVLFVGVSGSNQPHQIGKEVDAVRAGFADTVPAGATLRQVYIDYTAAAVTPSLVTPGGMDDYFASIQDGVDKLFATLNQSLSVCHGTEKWVLAGYSQGALVINNAVRGFFSNKPQLGKIVLVADPARVPGQVGLQLGSAQPGYGVYDIANLQLTALPAAVGPATISICDYHDIICDYDNASASLQWPYDIPVGVYRHTHYADDDYALLYGAGRRSAADTGFDPAYVRTTPAPLTGSVSQAPVGSGALLQPAASGFQPGETVHVVVHSTEVDLGTVVADPHGRVTARVTVPADVEPGAHEVVFYGASGTARVPFTVKDTTAPVITAHPDVAAMSTGSGATPVTYALPTATDAVDGNVPVTCSPASGATFRTGTTTVTCSAKDKAGNRATSSFAVTVAAPASRRADLQVRLIGPTTAVPGTSITYRLTVTNNGPAVATDVSAVLGASGLSSVTAGGKVTGGRLTVGRLIVTGERWSVASLPAGKSVTFTLSGVTGARTTRVSALGAALSGTVDPQPADNVRAAVTTVHR